MAIDQVQEALNSVAHAIEGGARVLSYAQVEFIYSLQGHSLNREGLYYAIPQYHLQAKDFFINTYYAGGWKASVTNVGDGKWVTSIEGGFLDRFIYHLEIFLQETLHLVVPASSEEEDLGYVEGYDPEESGPHLVELTLDRILRLPLEKRVPALEQVTKSWDYLPCLGCYGKSARKLVYGVEDNIEVEALDRAFSNPSDRSWAVKLGLLPC